MCRRWLATTAILHLTARGSAGCWCAATLRPASWPSTTAGRPARCRWPPWSGSPDAAGPSRNASRPPRPGRPGPASGPPLALLVPLDHPGHGRPRLPGRGRRYRPGPPPTAVRADQLDVQRGSASPRGAAHRPAGELGHRLRWSDWRRRHQARARTCHYRRQATRHERPNCGSDALPCHEDNRIMGRWPCREGPLLPGHDHGRSRRRDLMPP
jgi:hypothetical protein